ncbi:MAG: nucleotidyltransferase domain-containing protein [Candidatus Amulumruptor caecigallinarius]|nr:nucleotidyltransferase domain-containing protein [Candidatus Amulumruptor caecigallinarius]MCM1397520.1 nucleotidyltransferase domain-containing protein [Candidatus Amulumruptor caecigallinarius]MCM1454422.1 nucleotidyltransferase domain-containing protein [bacterium]
MTYSTQNYIKLIADYFSGKPVLRAWLFGSYSRGEETADSDIDILVDYDKTTRLSLLTICGMMTDLEDLLGKKVDLVENGRLKDFAVRSANNDKILIYERTAQR